MLTSTGCWTPRSSSIVAAGSAPASSSRDSESMTRKRRGAAGSAAFSLGAGFGTGRARGGSGSCPGRRSTFSRRTISAPVPFVSVSRTQTFPPPMRLEGGVHDPALDFGRPYAALVARGAVAHRHLGGLESRLGLPDREVDQPAGALLAQVVARNEAGDRPDQVAERLRPSVVVILEDRGRVEGRDADNAHGAQSPSWRRFGCSSAAAPVTTNRTSASTPMASVTPSVRKVSGAPIA